MAKRRDVKKDVLFFIEEVLADCLIFLELHQDKEYPEVEDIIDSMETLYEKSIYKINHIDKKEDESMKKYFDNIYNELLDGVHQALDQLSGIAKA